MSTERPLAIEHDPVLACASPQDRPAGRTVFVQLFDSIVSSGMLARLSGNALKVLSALGLAASPLGAGSPRDRSFFHDLVASGILVPSDRGRLFCCVAHDELVRRTGVGKTTLTRCTAELASHRMIEKRTVRGRNGACYNIYFILPASHLDKYNTLRFAAPPRPLPKTGTGAHSRPIPETGTVPKTGTNPRSNSSTTATTAVPGACAGFDREAVLAHFARRQGQPHYRPTAHDEVKLALLRQKGYSESEIRAAVDRAFDARPPDAPPIRLFSYCAAIALATPPRHTTPAAGSPGSAAKCVVAKSATPSGEATRNSAERDCFAPAGLATTIKRECSSPQALPHPAAAPADPGPCPALVEQVIPLYRSTIGPVTPVIRDELRTLTARYADPAEWDVAFHEAARANVLRLSYVQKVLEGRAARAASNLPPPGGTYAGNDTASPHSQRGPRDPARLPAAHPRRRPGTASGQALRAAQQRAAAMQPLDLVAVLGTPNA